MAFNDLSEVEKYVNGLNEEAKQRLISTISFMLINHVNQQNNLDSFSILQKLAALLPADSQKQLLSEMNSSIVKAMLKNNIDIFPVIQKLEGTLNEDNRKKVISDISFVAESISNKPNVSITATQPGGAGKQTNLNIERSSTILGASNNNSDVYTTPYGTNSVLRQTQNGQLRMTNNPPPPPPRDENKSPSEGNSLLRQTMTGPLRMTNPPPPTGNSNPPNNSLLRQTMNGPLRTTNPPVNNTGNAFNTTGVFNLKSSKDILPTMPAKETIQYLIPFHTDIGKRAIGDFSTPTEVYQFLKQVNGQITLDKIYAELYPRADIVSFIYKLYAIFHAKNIVFKKSRDMPTDRDPRVKIGEWMVVLGYIEPDKLERVVQLHNVAVRNFEVSNRRFAVKTMVNNQPIDSKGPLFGNFLVESSVITKQQLEQVLLVQTQFNEIISSVI